MRGERADLTEEALVAEAERLLRQGEPLLAYNVADAGLQRWAGNLRLRQLLALALARSGDTERANRMLGELARAGLDDAETLGVLARTHKDLGMRASDPERRAAHLQSAYRLYERAYASSRQLGAAGAAYYSGINAATVAVLRGQLAEARSIATEVLAICDATAAHEDGTETEYWLQATRGEAALILGDAPAAARHYAAAMTRARGRYGDLSTTRRQARLLAGHLPVDDAWLAEVLRVPPVLVFTAQSIHPPARRTEPFADLEGALRHAIRARLAATRPLAVYGSAACEPDLLCLEVAQELGAESHVVLPFPPDEFRKENVDTARGDGRARFDRVLGTADSVTITSDHRASDSAATFEYANLVMTGLGRLRAELLDTDLRGLAIWDTDDPARSRPASLVSVWERRGIPIEHVHLSGQELPARTPGREAPASRAAEPTGIGHQIKALLFADAVGFGRLSEDQIPRYVTGFLGAVAELNQRTRHRCEHVETAGDGLYMVFAEAIDAARYALELSALVAGTDWTAHELPAEFNLRIALHCGPVYCGLDPVTGSRLFTGPHTTRAARIEPITPPGQVYASSAFAAVAASGGGIDGIAMHYVGSIPLAKRSGSLPLYHLQPVA